MSRECVNCGSDAGGTFTLRGWSMFGIVLRVPCCSLTCAEQLARANGAPLDWIEEET